MLHKNATFKTYKTFLKHVETELSQNVESLEIRLPENMEIGTDDEKALTKAIEHVFPNATRYLCTKHLKDNVKHYLQNKVGVERKEREAIMNSIFGDDGIVDANSTIDFETRSSELDQQQIFQGAASIFWVLQLKTEAKTLWTCISAQSPKLKKIAENT